MKNHLMKRLLSLVLMVCMLAAYFVPGVSAVTVNYDELSMSQIINRDEKLTWVVAGDSITHNGSWSEGMTSWGEWIEQYVYDIGRTHDTVVVNGWGGAKLDHYQPGYTGDVGMGTNNFITKYNPDVVFIKLGMNNRPDSKSTFTTKYKAILDEIYRAGEANGKAPKVVLLTSTPLAGETATDLDYPGQDSVYRQVVWMNEMVASYNSANGRHIQVVDLRNAFVAERDALGDDWYSTFFFGPSDGAIHPNAAGQYLIFKTVAKTTGLYNASMPIFQQDYRDLYEGYLYVNGTATTYEGSYGPSTNDNAEMDKDMPAMEDAPIKLLAAIDFNSTNGSFAGGNTYDGATRVDLTDSSVMDDALTLEEVQSLEREYTLVFRARLDPSNKDNQPVLLISGNGVANWNNALALGVQGKGDQMYYEIRKSGTDQTNSANTFTIDANKTIVNSGWHTIAIVQKTDGLDYYVDGVLKATKAYKLNDGVTIGQLFASAPDFKAHIGSYTQNAGTYQLDGDLDYYQLYKGALSAEQIAQLHDNSGADSAKEMNKTMPTATGASYLAAKDFTSENGVFAGTSSYSTSTRLDLTDSTVMNDALTLEEVQAMGREFTVVLRAKLDSTTYRAHQNLLMIAPDGTADWINAISIGGPGTSHNLYYEVRQNSKEVTNSSNTIALAATTKDVRNQWHTIAIVQRTDGLDYYVDGVLAESKAYKLNDGLTFGGLFENTTDFAAHVGSFSQINAGTYNLKAKLDYYQFYGTALTADQILSLGSGVTAAADEMDATMPTLVLKAEAPKPIAAIDFDSTNGAITYNSGNITAGTVDLTDANVMDDALTLAEAQAMGKEYSVVFRYKSNVPSGRANLPLLYIAGTKTGGFSAQKNKLLMGMPGTSNIYFQASANGSNISSLTGATTNFGNLLTAMNDGKWHTVAVVQSASGLTYYVDGTAYPVITNNGAAVVLNETIGSMFTNVTADQLDAVFGRYGMTDVNWKTQGSFDFYQLYSTALSAAQVQELSGEEEPDGPNWSTIDHDNAVWAVVGDDNIAYYGGTVANRSLLRFIDNTARNCNSWTNRDIRILPFANSSYDPVYLANNFDSVFGGHNYSLFMLIPSVSSASVADYKAAVKTLMEKNQDKVRVLWTPLASDNATENANISLYAEAVREIAAADDTILFFDANKFMNEKMEGNATLKRNWFEVNGISPLCALDLTRAFYTHAGVAAFTQSEIKNHDLRLSSDTRARKTVVRDYIAPTVTASGSSITVDASALTAAYSGMTNLRVLVMPEVGFGTFSEVNWTKSFGNATTVTFDAPWANPVVTVLGDLNGYTYRFKDIPVAAAAGNPGVDYATDALTSLEVVGAPAIGFSADKTSYNVTLYQYQRNVQIRAQGGKNLTVTVNGQNVGVGKLSQKIAVNGNTTVTVKVTGGAAEQTYTLNLTRPATADIIITEIMQSTSNANYDMIEIYNASGRDLDLKDYALGYKKDYTDSVYTTQNMGKYPYYFTGDDQAFNSRNGSTQTYTGINAITHNSTFWTGDNALEEPASIPFPANSTMILWVKYGGASTTYETLVTYLNGKALTLEDGTKVVPTTDMVALAERPNGVTASGVTGTTYGAKPTANTNFHLEDHTTLVADGGNDNTTRSWLFILKDTAVRDNNVSVTAAGDDIISAGMFVRPTNSVDMATQLYYDADRGMSVVKNPVSYNATESGAPYTSDQYSYATFTTFGAIEYWQKPIDPADTQAAAVDNKTPGGVISGDDATIRLDITDNVDIRYVEVYVDADNDGTYETTFTKDLVLETSAKNEGVAADQTAFTYTHTLENLTDTANYYAVVVDAGGNTTNIGTADAPKTIEIAEPGQLKINMELLDVAGEASEEEVTVTVTLEKGTAVANLAGTYAMVNQEGDTVGQIVSGSGQITLANGEYVTVSNLPEGARYSITYTAVADYQDKTDAETLSGTIGTDGIVNITMQEVLKVGTVQATVASQDASGADTSDVTVKFTFVLDKGDSRVELAESYPVTVDGQAAGTTKDTVELSTRAVVAVQDLPFGAKVTLVPQLPEGYELVEEIPTVQISKTLHELKVAVQEALKTADLTVSASVKQADGSASDEKVTVKIDLSKGDSPVTLNASYDVFVGDTKVGTTSDAISLENGQKAVVKGLPVGAAYEIRVTPAQGYDDITETALTGKVAATGSVVAVAAKEKLITGSLSVSALLKLEDGSASTDKATVTVKLAKGNSPVALDSSYRVTNGSGTALGATDNGSFTWELGNGEQLVVEGLPEGTAYTVTLELPEGYENKTTDALTGNVAASGSAVNVAMQKLLVTADLSIAADVILEDGSASAETIAVQLTLTKGNSPVELAEKYDVYADGTKIGTTAEVLNIANGKTVTVKGLPVGTAYSLSITAPSGYFNTTTSISGNVAATGTTAKVSAQKILVTADLSVTAEVQLENGTASTEKLGVKITLTKGNAPVDLEESYEVFLGTTKIGTTADTLQLADGETVTVKGLPVGAAYAVAVTAPAGYENTTSGLPMGTVAATGATVEVSAQKLLVTADLEAVVELKKEDGSADTSATASLKITLTKGNSPVELAASYDVFADGQKVGTTADTITVESGKTVTVKGLPVGAAYEVKATAPSGYDSLDAVTGTIAETGNKVSFSAQKNLVTADLSITADVDMENGDTSGEKVQVKITLTKGNSPVNLAASYDVFVGTTKVGTTADTLQLADEETVTVKGLPVGTAYSVAVTVPEGYENTTTGATSGNVAANGAAVNVAAKRLLVTADLEAVVELKKEDGSADTSATASLKITLTKGSSLVDLAASYDVFADGQKVGTTADTITVESGKTVTVKGLPVGTAYSVTVEVPDGYDAPAAVADNIRRGENKVAFSAQKNLVTADLSITADVDLENGTASEDKILIQITLTKGNSPVDLADSYDIFVGNDRIGNTNNGVSIADGEVFTVKGLPVGTAYSVTVTAPEGYEDTTSGATSGNVTANGATVQLAAKKQLVTADLSISADVSLEDGTASTEKITVKINLTKGSSPVDLADSYDVYLVSNTTRAAVGEKVGTTNDTFQLAAGQTLIVKDLPVGAGYSITVTTPDGYEHTTSGATSGNLSANGAQITVSAEKTLVTGDLKVTLQILDVAGNDASTSVKAAVKLTLTKGNSPVELEATYKIVNASGVQIGTMENGVATVELSNGVEAIVEDLPVGTAYAVTVTVPEGYEGKTVNSSGSVTENGATAALKLQEQVKEGQLVVSTSIKKVDGTAAAYSVKANVTITLTKGNSPVNLAASYDIEDEGGTKIGTVTAGTGVIALADGQQAVIKGLPEGAAYSVNVTAPAGYANKTDISTTTGNIGTGNGAVAVVIKEILPVGNLGIRLTVEDTKGNAVTDQAVNVTVSVTKGSAPVALAASYDIVNGSGTKIGTLANGAATLSLKSGETATIKDLPQGVAYNIVVTAPTGYELSTESDAAAGNLTQASLVLDYVVAQKEQTPSEPTTEPTTAPTEPSATKPSDTPGTGDESNITLFIIVMVGSLVLIAVVVILFLASNKKKGKYSK